MKEVAVAGVAASVERVDPVETVACAAILLKSGLIVAGHRHHNCLSAMNYQGLLKTDVQEQGFMTTKGRFLGRREGLHLQLLAGIESACESGYRLRLNELFSEDLY